MRAIAVSSVVIAHGRNFLTSLIPAPALEFLAWLGVEIFFVLSGFLIGGILLRSDLKTWQGIRNFWKRRWFRTLPNYYLFCLVFLLLYFWKSWDIDSLWKYFFFLQSLYSQMPDFFGVSWSLVVEEWFYLGFPLLLSFWSRRANAIRWMLLPACLILIGSLGMRVWGSLVLDLPWTYGIKNTAIFRFDSLMYGFIGAWFKENYRSYWSRLRQLAWIGLFLTVLSVCLFYLLDLDHSFYARTFFFSVSDAAILLTLPFFDGLTQKTGKMAQFIHSLSEYSYSIYLAHIPLFYVSDWLDGMLQLYWSHSHLWTFFFWILLVYFLSRGVYKRFEWPITQLRDRAGFLRNPQGDRDSKELRFL